MEFRLVVRDAGFHEECAQLVLSLCALPDQERSIAQDSAPISNGGFRTLVYLPQVPDK
jgi:hypothetical protein